MNIYPADLNTGAPPAPPDWTMSVQLGGLGDGRFFYADLRRSGANICRLVIAGGAMSDDEAGRLLVNKARLWIADYLLRSRAGTTAFGPVDE